VAFNLNIEAVDPPPYGTKAVSAKL